MAGNEMVLRESGDSNNPKPQFFERKYILKAVKKMTDWLKVWDNMLIWINFAFKLGVLRKEFIHRFQCKIHRSDDHLSLY